jgi:hypothetical protein
MVVMIPVRICDLFCTRISVDYGWISGILLKTYFCVIWYVVMVLIYKIAMLYIKLNSKNRFEHLY